MDRSDNSPNLTSLAIAITILIVALAAWGWYYTNFASTENDNGYIQALV